MKRFIVIVMAISCARLTLAQDIRSFEYGVQVEDTAASDTNTSYNDNSLFLNRNEYLLRGADLTEDDVVLGIFVDTINMPDDKGVRQKAEHYYWLCIAKEDRNAYKTYLKEHRDLKKKMNKVFKDARNYEAALLASRAYTQKKYEGVSGEEAIVVLINTLIEASNQPK